MKQVYLDNAATTPVRLEVEVAMRPYFCEKYGNPSGVYQISSENRGMIENVREQIAKTLNASAEEIYFTSGGTESDNWAIKAAAQMLKEKGIIQSTKNVDRIVNGVDIDKDKNIKHGSTIAGVVEGNVSNAGDLYNQDKFATPRGHGFAAEQANHLYDKVVNGDFFGKEKVRLVGDDIDPDTGHIIKNGADRVVDGVWC